MDNKIFTLKEASTILHVSVRTLRAWIIKNKIKASKYENGGRLYITSEEIQRKLKELK